MRSVPEDNLAYPVLLQCNTGSTGSGFLLRSGSDMFIVTAKHVLFKPTNELLGDQLKVTCPSRDHSDSGVHRYAIDLQRNAPVAHPTSDVAVIKLGTMVDTADSMVALTIEAEGVTKLESSKSGMVCLDPQTTAKPLADVLVSNDVFLFGYPVSLGLAPSAQFEFDRPLLRKGIVANTYVKQGTIILDCPAYAGNSGGPVIELEWIGFQIKYRVIGVLSQFIPQKLKRYNSHTGKEVDPELANSGYSVAVCMDKVFELIGHNPTVEAGVTALVAPSGVNLQ